MSTLVIDNIAFMTRGFFRVGICPAESDGARTNHGSQKNVACSLSRKKLEKAAQVRRGMAFRWRK